MENKKGIFIKLKSKKMLLILLMIIILGTAGAIYAYQSSTGLDIETVIVQKGSVYDYVEEIAAVKSENQQIVYSTVIGEIKKIDVQVGDFVNKGTVLAELDTKEIELNIESLKSQMEGLEASFKEALRPADKERLNEAEANVESMKIRLEEAKRNEENNRKLYDEDIISFNTYKAYLDALSLQEHGYNIAINELNLLNKGVSENIKQQYESQINELKYQIEIMENNKNKMLVKAPINGIITEIFSKEGQYLQPGMQLLEIADENKLYLETDILASEISGIKENSPVVVYSEDLSIEEKKGTVSKIYPKAFSKISDLGIEQKRVKVEIDFNEDISDLKVGYNVDVNIVIDSKENIVAVPDSAVFELEGEKYVFAVVNGTAVLRKVEMVIEGKDKIGIGSGLAEGEKIVLSPDNNVEEGINIKQK